MLNKLYLLGCALWSFANVSEAQIVREFAVEERHGFEVVQVDFSSYKGGYKIKKMHSSTPVHIHAHLSKVNILPDFNYSVKNNVLYAQLNHSNVETESLGKSLSSKFFANKQSDFDHTWDVGLSHKYIYDLNFNFGIGVAHLDLSNLSMKRCKVKTATADVNLDFSEKSWNPIDMDTMSVRINMGTVNAVNIVHSNADKMIFDVNYGKVNLNFKDKTASRKACNISATVGAGSVYVVLPSSHLPYLVKVKSTAMCRTSLPGHLSEISNKTYVSKGYKENADNLMTFDFDVSVGSLILK